RGEVASRRRQPRGRGSDRARAGANGEGGLGARFPALPKRAHAVAAREDHLAVLDDRDGEPGNFPLVHGRPDVRVHPSKWVATTGGPALVRGFLALRLEQAGNRQGTFTLGEVFLE